MLERPQAGGENTKPIESQGRHGTLSGQKTGPTPAPWCAEAFGTGAISLECQEVSSALQPGLHASDCQQPCFSQKISSPLRAMKRPKFS
jgi:hypothetical protein